MRELVAVHGIGNHRPRLTPDEAADRLSVEWRTALGEGLRRAGLAHVELPPLRVAYYADVLADADADADTDTDTDTDAQAAPADRDLADLMPQEAAILADLLRANGVREAEAQGPATGWLRQGIDLLARRRGGSARLLGRVGVAFAGEVYAYLARPERRRRARGVLAERIAEARPTVLLAHSLGSVVAFETLHAHPEPSVDLLVTLGSPLGLPAIYEALEPEPTGGRAARPPGLGRWVNIADRGDLVAVPRELGGRFPVDQHVDSHIALLDFHLMGNYLRSGMTATAIAPYL